jgi:DNA (cytosine-5)-methyltransferase 1
MTYEQIKRLKEEQLRKIYNNIKITKNLVNIQNVKGKDLEIVDTDKYDYILTYSFPCQDLSLAGKRKGMSDTSTRSGMLWEVERILSECKEIGQLPQVLLMENVPQVHSTNNLQDFNKWQLRLEELGYKNYWQDLIATDYGIPQTRNRTFMVSILGDYNYDFPKPIPLKLKLKDMLEDEVDEKYYLSDKMIDYCMGTNQKDSKFPRKERFLKTLNKVNDEDIAVTISTNAGNRPVDNFIVIPEATKKGYALATDGDGVYINRPQQKRGVVQKGKIQTLKTSCDDVGVVVNSNIKNINDENKTFSTLGTNCGSSTSAGGGVIVLGNYSPSGHEASRILDSNGLAPTFKENHGTINATQTSDLRIRKLTPREVFRLMGVKDEDYERIAKNQSDSSLYHLAGDSIVVDVLMAIFKELLKDD